MPKSKQQDPELSVQASRKKAKKNKTESEKTANNGDQLCPAQEQVVMRSHDMLHAKGVAYVTGPPGIGKTHVIRGLVEQYPCTGERAYLNIVVVSQASLLPEMATKVTFAVQPPFNTSRTNQLTRHLCVAAKDRRVVTIPITHKFFKSKLCPSKSYPYATFVNFIQNAIVGVKQPVTILIIIDEAHHLCTPKWSFLLRELKMNAKNKHGFDIQLALVSATPKMEKASVARSTLAMFGAPQSELTTRAKQNDGVQPYMVEFTDDEVQQIRSSKVFQRLPRPSAVATIERLRSPLDPDLKGNLAERLKPMIDALEKIYVGNLVCRLLQLGSDTRKYKLIASTNAIQNIIGVVLTTLTHCDPDTGSDMLGGNLFNALAGKVKTAIVGPGPDYDLIKKEKARESVLVVHGTARGLAKHMRFLDAMGGEGQEAYGIPMYSTHDLSLSSLAKDNRNNAAFFDAFREQTKGATFGFVLPRHLEGTDKYNKNVTKIVLIGPMDKNVLEQVRGRFDRPFVPVKGERVRVGQTVTVHMQSEWAEKLRSIGHFNDIAAQDAPAELKARVDSSAHNDEAWKTAKIRDLILKMAMKLDGAETGGIFNVGIVDFFLELLKDPEKRDRFMKEKVGEYRRLVKTWASNKEHDPEESENEDEDEESEENEEEDGREEEEEEEED